MTECDEMLYECPGCDKNGWINVEDRLPNHYDKVLIVSELENKVYMAYFDKDINMFMGAHHMWTTREAKYWQPLFKEE